MPDEPEKVTYRELPYEQYEGTYEGEAISFKVKDGTHTTSDPAERYVLEHGFGYVPGKQTEVHEAIIEANIAEAKAATKERKE